MSFLSHIKELFARKTTPENLEELIPSDLKHILNKNWIAVWFEIILQNPPAKNQKNYLKSVERLKERILGITFGSRIVMEGETGYAVGLRNWTVRSDLNSKGVSRIFVRAIVPTGREKKMMVRVINPFKRKYGYSPVDIIKDRGVIQNMHDQLVLVANQEVNETPLTITFFEQNKPMITQVYGMLRLTYAVADRFKLWTQYPKMDTALFDVPLPEFVNELEQQKEEAEKQKRWFESVKRMLSRK